nr:hypothetical protein [Clostridia bacterium]
ILGDKSPVLDDCRKILEKMPKYPLSGPSKYGVHLRDSEDAPDNLWIRHPSMLMPVFPIGELDINSDPETVQIISNTLDFLEENCEIGVFPCSWLAAAAARIGRGQFAYRTLYEKGIDHLSRSNGLTAEETDRFINFCLISRQPLYYPCMMEFTGEMLAAVNEMLLQSHNDIIRVFPAIPDGDKEYGRHLRNGYDYSDYKDRYIDYAAWNDVRFDKLLAKGAFEVTAELKDRKLSFILIHSKKGGKVNVTSPFICSCASVWCDGKAVDAEIKDGVFSFATEPGKDYIVAESADVCTAADVSAEVYDDSVTGRMTYTRRNLYIGEDSDTRYQKQLDSFLRDWYFGNMRMSNHTLYKFDFGTAKDKDYEATIPLQAHAYEGHMLRGMDFVRLGAEEFTAKVGYGFDDVSGMNVVERTGPDPLRYDLVEGENAVEFIIDAPRGQYELLVVSGDTEEDSVTIASTENSRVIGGSVVKKGSFQAEVIPFVQDRDVPIRLRISTIPGYKWKLNAVVLNVTRGY